MGRAERRRAEREHRKAGTRPGRGFGGWTPPTNTLTRAKVFSGTPEELDRERQDFIAGTVFAAGAGIMQPTSGISSAPVRTDMPTPFAVFLNEDDTTWGPAPQLKEAFKLLDTIGPDALRETLVVGTAWSAIDHPDDPLIKLKLQFHEPMKGDVGVILVANNYADHWHHLSDGGLIALTSFARMRRATSKPDATFADGLEASLLMTIGVSPILRHVITSHGWPTS
jgi:hypothetical protein